jgi:hypothetical protein
VAERNTGGKRGAAYCYNATETTMTRERADELARDLARRSGGHVDVYLERLTALDHDTAEMVKARLMERGAEAVLRESTAL